MKLAIIKFVCLIMFSFIYSLKVKSKVAEDLMKTLEDVIITSKQRYSKGGLAKIRGACPQFGKLGGQTLCDETFRRNKNGLCRWNGSSCESLV